MREALDIVVDTSLSFWHVVRTLEQIRPWRGAPTAICRDDGPELIDQAFVDWCEENQVGMRDIHPGKPNQNADLGRFSRTYRSEVVDAYLFETLGEVHHVTERWLKTYNAKRRHGAPGQVPPAVFRSRSRRPRRGGVHAPGVPRVGTPTAAG